MGVKRQARRVVRKAMGATKRRVTQVGVPGDNPAAQALNALITPVPRLSERRKRKRTLKKAGRAAGRAKR